MKKKILNFIFSLLFILPAMFLCVACSNGTDPGSGSGGNGGSGNGEGETTYTVNFIEKKWVENPNGGEELTNILFTTQFCRGDNVQIPTEEYLRENNKILYYPEDEYTISYWYCNYDSNVTSTSFNDEFFSNVAIEESWSNTKITTFEVYANFSNKPQPITYVLDGGENHPDNPETIDYLDEIQMPTREGYYFAGWTVSCDGENGTKVDTPTRNLSGIVGKNCILTAHWELNQVVFDGNANNGGSSMQPISYNEGESVELPTTTTFIKTNCSFKGWSTTPYEADMISGEFSPNGGEVTLYAIWKSDNLWLTTYSDGYDYELGRTIYGYMVRGIKEGSAQVKEVYIPKELNGFKVGKVRFYDCDTIESVLFEDGVELITKDSSDNYSNENVRFFDCDNLKTLQVPQAVKKIDSDFLQYCFLIDNLILHNELEEISYTGNNALKSLTIPSKVTKLVLTGMNVLTSLNVSSSVVELELTNLGSLVSLTIPNTVETITLNTLTSLQELSIPTIYKKIYNVMYGTETYVGMEDILQGDCSQLKKLTITDTFENGFYGRSDMFPLANLVNLEEVNVKSNTYVFINMFYNLSKLKTINLNEDISYIGNNAFVGCSSLQSITIPKNITSFNESMFQDCTNLKEINYTQNFSVIPTNFAKNCSSLTSFKFNCNVEVQESAFEGCSSLVEFVNDNYITTITGTSAFRGTGVSSINLANIIDTYIKHGTFRDCANLSQVVLPNSVDTLAGYSFANCVSLTDLTQFSNIINLWSGCFSNIGITSLSFWDNLNFIEGHVFERCKNLVNINFEKYKLNTITSSMFADCSNLSGELTIPKTISTISIYAFTNTGFSSIVYQDGESLEIKNSAFSKMRNLKTVTIEATSLKLNEKIFNDVSTITDLVLSSGYITVLDEYNKEKPISLSHLFGTTTDFYNQNSNLFNTVEVDSGTSKGIVQVNVPNSLINLTLKNTVATAGYSSSTLKTFSADSNLTTIYSDAFKNCANLTNVNIPNLLVAFDYAFYNCTKLSAINLSNILRVDSYAFYNCTSLTGDLSLPDSKGIYGYAFSKTNIESISFGEETDFHGSKIFADCVNLKSVDFSLISNTSADLPQYIFENCTGLTTINLDNINGVYDYAFKGCSNITEIDLGSTLTSLSANAFFDLSLIKKIEIPVSLKDNKNEADLTCLSSLEELIINTTHFDKITSNFSTYKEGYNVFKDSSLDFSYYPTTFKKLTINCSEYIYPNCINDIADCIDEVYINITYQRDDGDDDIDVHLAKNKLFVLNDFNKISIKLNDEAYYNNFSTTNCYVDNFENIYTIYVAKEIIDNATTNNTLNQIISDETLFDKVITTSVYDYYTYNKKI
ncbi:MAG: leucine-rich repeat protein [Clostridia bacterium]|nr:leucine-rich repeat protein [Clostridia bacterium]